MAMFARRSDFTRSFVQCSPLDSRSGSAVRSQATGTPTCGRLSSVKATGSTARAFTPTRYSHLKYLPSPVGWQPTLPASAPAVRAVGWRVSSAWRQNETALAAAIALHSRALLRTQLRAWRAAAFGLPLALRTKRTLTRAMARWRARSRAHALSERAAIVRATRLKRAAFDVLSGEAQRATMAAAAALERNAIARAHVLRQRCLLWSSAAAAALAARRALAAARARLRRSCRGRWVRRVRAACAGAGKRRAAWLWAAARADEQAKRVLRRAVLRRCAAVGSQGALMRRAAVWRARHSRAGVRGALRWWTRQAAWRAHKRTIAAGRAIRLTHSARAALACWRASTLASARASAVARRRRALAASAVQRMVEASSLAAALASEGRWRARCRERHAARKARLASPADAAVARAAARLERAARARARAAALARWRVRAASAAELAAAAASVVGARAARACWRWHDAAGARRTRRADDSERMALAVPLAAASAATSVLRAWRPVAAEWRRRRAAGARAAALAVGFARRASHELWRRAARAHTAMRLAGVLARQRGVRALRVRAAEERRRARAARGASLLDLPRRCRLRSALLRCARAAAEARGRRRAGATLIVRGALIKWACVAAARAVCRSAAERAAPRSDLRCLAWPRWRAVASARLRAAARATAAERASKGLALVLWTRSAERARARSAQERLLARVAGGRTLSRSRARAMRRVLRTLRLRLSAMAELCRTSLAAPRLERRRAFSCWARCADERARAIAASSSGSRAPLALRRWRAAAAAVARKRAVPAAAAVRCSSRFSQWAARSTPAGRRSRLRAARLRVRARALRALLRAWLAHAVSRDGERARWAARMRARAALRRWLHCNANARLLSACAARGERRARERALRLWPLASAHAAAGGRLREWCAAYGARRARETAFDNWQSAIADECATAADSDAAALAARRRRVARGTQAIRAAAWRGALGASASALGSRRALRAAIHRWARQVAAHVHRPRLTPSRKLGGLRAHRGAHAAAAVESTLQEVEAVVSVALAAADEDERKRLSRSKQLHGRSAAPAPRAAAAAAYPLRALRARQRERALSRGFAEIWAHAVRVRLVLATVALRSGGAEAIDDDIG